ncbi:hypothetical protein SBRCBS47491_009707 [Sporothrix bragantina]|uniref:Major facilitator superfamily (MFS) profile domain-containing protein n=1 Tax=Sporothrix bragantina TaxID=671064 RepID=A0ABP0CYJ9_9PEZI
MGLGVLDTRDGHHAPGTVTLDLSAAHVLQAEQVWKRGSGKDADIVLVPQPSEDANDPLNWPSLKKFSVFFIILLGTAFITVVPAPMLNAGIAQVSIDLDRSFSDITKQSGYMLLSLGAVSPFASALARKYGKRPVFVVSSIFGLAGCLVAESANTYSTLVAGRVLQGVGASAYESLCTSVVTDLYFVHQRGFYVAMVVFFLTSLSNGVSVLAGLITTNLGWHYNFYILLPFVALQTILVIFFVPETTYNRSIVYNIDRVGSEDDEDNKEERATQTSHVETSHAEKEVAPTAPDAVPFSEERAYNDTTGLPPRKSYVQQLALYNGVFTDKPLWAMVLASFVIMANAIASFNIFISGLIMAWFVAMSVIAGVMFTLPPWGFDAAQIGYVSAGPLIGGTIASAFLALVSDPLIRYMTRKNKGVYEPEFRLVLASVGGALTISGLSGFGYTVQTGQSIYLISFLWGMTLCGMSIVASITMAYALDSHPAHSVEIFIMNITFKNFFFYGLTNYIVEWFTDQGAQNLFGVIAGITGFLMLLTFPMYIYGKRYRHYWSSHNLLVKLHLDDDPHASHDTH